MASPLDAYRPFDAGAGANTYEAGWRAMARWWCSDGPVPNHLNACQTIGDSTGLQVKVRPGDLFIQGHHGEVQSLKALPVLANTSGNPRVDLVVARLLTEANRIELDVVQGTPAASPSAPALTQTTTVWEIPLGYVAVAHGAATITAGNVTDGRVFSHGLDWSRAWGVIAVNTKTSSSSGLTGGAASLGLPVAIYTPAGRRLMVEFSCQQAQIDVAFGGPYVVDLSIRRTDTGGEIGRSTDSRNVNGPVNNFWSGPAARSGVQTPGAGVAAYHVTASVTAGASATFQGHLDFPMVLTVADLGPA